ncbi:MAG: TetR/AcrR family transcriptional regulator [Oscillospiraceae bacterium]|nr:TetR/AcrR family transcriptional regulator [Oscillospiraceae bacterium]
MDRRQKKTRSAIFRALITLLSKKDYDRITVGDIIQLADVGRATFYAHFETKESLLKALCEELFAHIFEAEAGSNSAHTHIFDCDAPDSVFLHLFRHLQKNDNSILDLLSSRNNGLFLGYFRENLKKLAESQLHLFSHRKAEALPEAYWVDHIAATFVQTLRWWLENGRQESPEQIATYFFLAV